MHSPQGGSIQAYNAQAAVSADGLVVAAELTQQPVDVDQLVPMVAATLANVAAAGFGAPVGTVLADGGYWSEANMAGLPDGVPELLVPPTAGRPRQAGEVSTRRRPRPARERMAAVLATGRGAGLYRRRQAIVEPMFGQIKEGQEDGASSGGGFDACLAEWRLICATHNLLKLWRSRLARHPARPPSASQAPAGPPPRSRPEGTAGPGWAAPTTGHPRHRGPSSIRPDRPCLSGFVRQAPWG